MSDQVITNTLNAPTVFRDADLASVTDFDSVLALFKDMGITPESMSDYGTGFEVVKDKSTLVGVPFMILEWRFNKSDHADDKPFVSAAAVTRDGRKIVINDGGSGICDQLIMVTGLRKMSDHPQPQAGLMVQQGLTRSDYEYTDEKGKTAKATTYYLSE